MDSGRYAPDISWRRSADGSRNKVCRHSGSRLGRFAQILYSGTGKVVTDQPFTDKQRWIELLIPGAETGVALYRPEGHEKRIGEFQSIAFWCDDAFATAKVLKSKGVTFAQEPKNQPWGAIGIFKEPDGNQFTLSSKVNRK